MQEKSIFTPGELIRAYYTDYDTMVKSAKHWQQKCVFQFRPSAIEGEHHIFELSSMQLSYAKKIGGIMYMLLPPPNCITVSIICKCADKGCFGTLKLHTGDIIFYDDTHAYNYFSSNYMEICSINIDKVRFPELTETFSRLQTNGTICFKNNNDYFCTLFTKVLEKFPDRHTIDTGRLKETEDEIIATVLELMETKKPVKVSLTKGERAVFDIVEKVYTQMDKNIPIHSLAKLYDISEQTLQVNFKALYGITPKHFLQMLRLNMVHQELLSSHPKHQTVMQVASKWGFTHMGNFSKYYTNLFGENPSITLQRGYIDTGLKEECVIRTEELY